MLPLVLWTIRISMLFYAGYLFTQFGMWRASFTQKRWLWTAACTCFCLHFVAAFHYHHWSHARIFADTAKRTGELLGWEFGAGIYFSYFFTALWVFDAAWSWFAEASYQTRASWLSRTIHLYLFFIAFNGAVIFEDGITRPVGILATLVVAVLLVRQWFFRPVEVVGEAG